MSQEANEQTASDNYYTSSAGWYTLSYPAHWTLSEDEECVTLCDPADGVGALQVSAYQTPEPQDPGDLLFEYFSDHALSLSEEVARYYESGATRVAVAEYIREDGYFFRVWFIVRETSLLMVTYNCKFENLGIEMDVVERIIDSIEVANP